jgi:hypothetical protein
MRIYHFAGSSKATTANIKRNFGLPRTCLSF